MTAPSDEHSGPLREAERIYVSALARLDEGQALDLSALCCEHTELADALRLLHDHWEALRQSVRELPSDVPFSELLRRRFGSRADPHISLQGKAEPVSGFSSEVLSRLAGRQSKHSRYKLEGEVARGGMGAILRVWDEDLRRHLAMKVVLGKEEEKKKGGTPEITAPALARFLEEAQVTGQLDHPGIVPVHELGLDADGRVYFTMKLVKGVTLGVVFDELAEGGGSWTQTRVLGLLHKVCEAMAYAHDKDVIHRDLKPDNVMVGRFGEVYVMDWGLAKILGREDDKDLRVREEGPMSTLMLHSDRKDMAGEVSDSPLFTMDGDVVGTPAYMSPEQAAGRVSEMGPQADVYALGAMLYQLLAGHMPYVPKGARFGNYDVWRFVQEGPPKALHEVAPHQPAELVAICEKSMARDAKERYPDTSALAEDLSAFIEGRVVRAYETGAWAEARKWFKRNRSLAVALAFAVVLAVGGLGGIGYVQAKGRKVAEVERERADKKADEAERNLHLAQIREVEAMTQRGLAEAATARVLRLSDGKTLQKLNAEAEALWPPYPHLIPALESWLARADELVASLAKHRATLMEMRGRATPWSDEERARDRATHPRAGELTLLREKISGRTEMLDDDSLSEQDQSLTRDRLAKLESELVALVVEVEVRRTWGFDSQEETWHHDVLAELVESLEEFARRLSAGEASLEEGGWSISRRLKHARELEEEFTSGGEYERAWSAALPSIRAAYPGLALTQQMGLLPLGPDPDSGLWEFAHLSTGAPATRGQDGGLVLSEDTGVVLVLLPGGTFWMGAQSGDDKGRNYDPMARPNEGPVHEVELSAFFISKYELTQGQWQWFTGRNPSQNSPQNWQATWLASGEPGSLLHPVEQVSWNDCKAWLERMGLSLPSEAQWEYAARGGTDSPWWTGAETGALKGAANLSDKYANENGGSLRTVKELWLDDGAMMHAPVGSYRANPFGLHDVAGNVWEWCLDGYYLRFYKRSALKDPIAPWDGMPIRLDRGGSFFGPAVAARSTTRDLRAPTVAADALGVRPARAITR